MLYIYLCFIYDQGDSENGKGSFFIQIICLFFPTTFCSVFLNIYIYLHFFPFQIFFDRLKWISSRKGIFLENKIDIHLTSRVFSLCYMPISLQFRLVYIFCSDCKYHPIIILMGTTIDSVFI